MPILKSKLAEITGKRQYKIFAVTVILILLLCLRNAGQQIKSGQQKESRDKKKIELLYCDVLLIDKELNKDLQRLLGNVALRHNDIIMTCDSAYLYSEANQVKAYGNVKINQADTLFLTGNYLYYDGNEEKAFIQENVELRDKETQLFTSVINYDSKTKTAYYTVPGKIINGDNILTSHNGIYYASDKTFHFKDSVKIVNPDYTMLADTLEYNSETGTAYFRGPTTIEGDSLFMYCERGWYDTQNDLTSVWGNPLIDNRQNTIRGDSLFYNRKTGYGEAYRNISITDTSNNIIVCGNYAWYYKNPERFMVTDRALFIQVSEEDSLFLHADTLKAVTIFNPDDSSSYRLLRAYYTCKVFSTDLQSLCDSLAYSFRDSVIHMYKNPIIWSEENQMTADSVSVLTKNRKADRLELYNSVFVASQIDSIRFNQMKGRKLTGFFRENKLYRILIEGNGETIYYLIDKNELIGVNHARSASIEIIVENKKITEITELHNPEGTLDPPGMNPPEVNEKYNFVTIN